MNTDSENHIFTSGERQMRDRAQQALEEARNLLDEPISRDEVREALKRSRAATAALEFLDQRAAGVPAPKRGE